MNFKKGDTVKLTTFGNKKHSNGSRNTLYEKRTFIKEIYKHGGFLSDDGWERVVYVVYLSGIIDDDEIIIHIHFERGWHGGIEKISIRKGLQVSSIINYKVLLTEKKQNVNL